MELKWKYKVNEKQEYFEACLGMDKLWVYTEKGVALYKGMYLRDGCLYLLYDELGENKLLTSADVEYIKERVLSSYVVRGFMTITEEIKN